MSRATTRYAGRVVLALALLTAPFASQGGASHTKKKARVTVRRIGAGAYYKKIVKPKKHWVIHLITVKLAAESSIDVALAGNELGNIAPLSSIASRSGAIAAINGDFGTRYRRPWNTYAEDGHLIQTETSWGRALSVNAPETKAFIGHPRLRVTLKPDDGEPLKIDRVNNGRPELDEVGLFTRAGRKVERTPLGACSSRLLSRGRPKLNPYGNVTRRYEVDVTRCEYDRMSLQHGIVVGARRGGNRKTDVKALVPGRKAMLTWSMRRDNSVDIIGGNPMIVYNGRILSKIVYDCGYLCELHPRSAAGFTKDGKLLMVVVDGRAEGVRGMHLYELARFLVRQGADRALTFDGGGAAEMWIKGDIVSTPSDGHERPTVNALLLLSRKDERQPDSLGVTSSSGAAALEEYDLSSTMPAQERATDAAAKDPGSLGGLADFLERRGEPLPGWMKRIARDIRRQEGD